MPWNHPYERRSNANFPTLKSLSSASNTTATKANISTSESDLETARVLATLQQDSMSKDTIRTSNSSGTGPQQYGTVQKKIPVRDTNLTNPFNDPIPGTKRWRRTTRRTSLTPFEARLLENISFTTPRYRPLRKVTIEFEPNTNLPGPSSPCPRNWKTTSVNLLEDLNQKGLDPWSLSVPVEQEKPNGQDH